jgi:hypothetical protein
MGDGFIDPIAFVAADTQCKEHVRRRTIQAQRLIISVPRFGKISIDGKLVCLFDNFRLADRMALFHLDGLNWMRASGATDCGAQDYGNHVH